MATHPPCPPVAELAQLLRGDLTAVQESQLAVHLDECAGCRYRLEGLAAGDETLAGFWGRGDLPEVEPAEGLQEAIQELKDCTHTVGMLPEYDPDESLLLGFLSPPDRSDSLGRIGGYAVTEIIGRGGMGIVLKAFDSSLHRFVAIKVLAPHLASSPAARKRFAREGRAAAAVCHEHIVAVHGVDEARGLPYLVMEYVSGISLQDHLDRAGPLEACAVLRVGVQTAAGLAAAHKQGLIHRDIKPANILLVNGVERVKITDFGLARAADDASLTQSGVVSGTPQYMAPEQARGEALDGRADLFSLGSVLYALCTGRMPFRAGTTLAVLRRICEDTPRPIADLNPEVPDGLIAVIDRLHAKDRTQRFQSAAEVAEVMSQYLAHLQQPGLVPRPAGLARQAVPRPGRGRSRRWAVAGLLLLTCASLLAAAWADGAGRWMMAVIYGRGLSGRPDAAAIAAMAVRPRRGPENLDGPILGAAFAPGSEMLALACDDRTVQLWNLAGNRKQAVLFGHGERVWSVAFSPDGSLLASCSGDWVNRQTPGVVRLWDVTTGKLVRVFEGHTSAVVAVAFSRDGQKLASAGLDGSARVWDPKTGREHCPPRLHTALVRSVAFSPDSRMLATGDFDHNVVLWNATTGEESARLHTELPHVNCVAFSHDGKTLAVATNPIRPGPVPASQLEHGRSAGQVELWDVKFRQRRVVFREHRGMVLSVAFSPDGRTVVSGGGDWNAFGEIKLWDASLGSEWLTLHAHRQWVECVAFSPDGRLLVSAGGIPESPGEVNLWEVGPAPIPPDVPQAPGDFQRSVLAPRAELRAR